MKIDISRDTFKASKAFTHVLMQQGRVQLDADWNEQVNIFWHSLHALAMDVVGKNWGPGNSLLVVADKAANPKSPDYQLSIYPGHYYVHGLLCERHSEGAETLATVNTFGLTPAAHSDLKLQQGDTGKFDKDHKGALIYLCVRESLVTFIEDPAIREVALGGADTAARTKVVCQLVAQTTGPKVTPRTALYYKIDYEKFTALLKGTAAEPGKLTAQAKKPPTTGEDGPCVLAPDARFRGLENQLYRVEIFKSGNTSAPGTTAVDDKLPYFVWDSNNGSVVAHWVAKKGNELTIDQIGREGLLGFAAGHWIQLTDDERELADPPGTLVKLIKVDGPRLTIDPSSAIGSLFDPDEKKHPKVRRWDSPGWLPVQVPSTHEGFIPLEDGIEVQFESGKHYQVGSYWLIPARTALGDIEWPRDKQNNPKALEPYRPRHYAAPLVFIAKPEENAPPVLVDLRTTFPRTVLWGPPPSPDLRGDLPDQKRADELQLDKSKVLLFRLVGVGYQTYTCQGGKWADPPEPRATLFDEHGALVGRHFLGPDGPVWEASDGSKVVGDLKNTNTKPFPAPDPRDLAWLKILAHTHPPEDRFGVFGKVTAVQRLYTVGGGKPEGNCDPARESSRAVPYMATYYFYGDSGTLAAFWGSQAERFAQFFRISNSSRS